MAYVAPSTVTTLQTYTSAAHNIIVNDIIDHETYISPLRSAWTSWTPAFTAGGWATSGGAASFSGKYIQVGKTVLFWSRIIMGSSITGGTYMNLSIPVAASSVGALSGITVMARDYGLNWHPLFVAPGDSSTTSLTVYASTSGGTYVGGAAVTGTVPFTWAQNDEVTYGGTYEAA